MGRLKRNWERDMIDLYFFNESNPYENGEYTFETYPAIGDYNILSKVFYSHSKEDFLEKLARRVNSQSYSFKLEKEDIPFSLADMFKNEYGHWQIDIKEKRTGETLFTSVFDDSSLHTKMNCFYMNWREANFPSFNSGELYHYFFPKNTPDFTRGTNIFSYLGQEATFELDAHEEKIIAFFECFKQKYKMRIGHSGKGSLFDPGTWNTKLALVEHIVDDEECLVCGLKKEESMYCPFFEIANRKQSLLVFIQQKTKKSRSLFRYTVNALATSHSIQGLNASKEEVIVKSHIFESKEPYMHLRIIASGFAYELSNIKWIPNQLHAKHDMTKLVHWDYENATLNHVSSFSYYHSLSEYELNEECAFCKREFRYLQDFHMEEASICHCLNNNKEFKKSIVELFLRRADYMTFAEIGMDWPSMIKEYRAKVDVVHQPNIKKRNHSKNGSTGSVKRVHIKKKHRNDFYLNIKQKTPSK